MDIFEIRFQQLRTAINLKCGGVVKRCADRLGMPPSQLHRWLSKKKESRQNIHETSARRIEVGLELPSGWLDQEPGSVPARTISPAARDFVSTTERLASEGALTDDDMQMLRDLAERLASRKAPGA